VSRLSYGPHHYSEETNKRNAVSHVLSPNHAPPSHYPCSRLTEELGFKERVKNDIVLIEAVPEFKPIVAKKDYEEEERLRRERGIFDREQELLEIERQVQEDEQLMMEKEIVADESELLEREQWIEQRERELVKRELRLQAREMKLRHRMNRKVRRHQNNRTEIRERKLGHQQKRKVRRHRNNRR
jgi:hypothetical protein